jgi:hypothetical protein
LQGKRRPFENLSSADANSHIDQVTTSEDDTKEDADTEDSPWEISSSSDDDNPPKPSDRWSPVKDAVCKSQSQRTKTAQQSIPDVLLVQKPTKEVPQLIESIKFTVTCLYKIPIRRPAPIDRLKQKGSVDASFYHPFDVLYIKDKFPMLDEKVATRLGKMISRRRQLLSYRRSHDESLETKMVEPRIVIAAPAVPDSTQISNSNGPAIEPQAFIARSHADSSRFTLHTKATTLRLNAPQFETSTSLIAHSVAESKSSMASSYTYESLRVEVPPRPTGENGATLTSFNCPYCLVNQSIKTDHAWKYVLHGMKQANCV